MSRLEDVATYELWNISKEAHDNYYTHMTAKDYHTTGINRMTQANKDFADKHRVADILEHKIYMQRIKTIRFYEKRLAEIGSK